MMRVRYVGLRCMGVVVLACVAGILFYNFAHRTTQRFVYDFSGNQKSVSPLYPADRVSVVQKAHDHALFQEIAASPVYLDLWYWQRFRHAVVTVVFEKPTNVQFGIGYKAGEDFQWSIQGVSGQDCSAQRCTVRLVFDLSGEHEESKNRHRWIFSAPDIAASGKGIRVYSLTFEFEI